MGSGVSDELDESCGAGLPELVGNQSERQGADVVGLGVGGQGTVGGEVLTTPGVERPGGQDVEGVGVVDVTQ